MAPEELRPRRSKTLHLSPNPSFALASGSNSALSSWSRAGSIISWPLMCSVDIVSFWDSHSNDLRLNVLVSNQHTYLGYSNGYVTPTLRLVESSSVATLTIA